MRKLWHRMQRRDDAGFTLVEMVVAMLIAGMVFGALATTLIAAVRTSLLSRQNQQAADFMTQAIEDMRLEDFGSLSVDASLLAAGPVPLATCAGGATGATIDGPSSCYPLVEPATGTDAGVDAVSMLVGDGTPGDTHTNNTTYTLYRYVTEVYGQSDAAVRRVTVYITWQLNGALHTRSSSTVISYSQRGLPLPYFTFKESTGGACVNPDSTAVHTFTLENKGAPDRWSLALAFLNSYASDPDAASFKVYADTDHSGDYGSGDALLTDTDGDGKIDTGRVDPGTLDRFFLVRPTSGATALGNHDVTITATSVAQPLASSATQTLKALTVVQSAACDPSDVPTPTPTGSSTPTPTPTVSTPPVPVDAVCSAVGSAPTVGHSNGHTVRTYLLHNNGLSTSELQTQLNFNSNATLFSALGAYSTNVDPALPGRVVAPAVAGDGTPIAVTSSASLRGLTDLRGYADWSADFSKPDIQGDGAGSNVDGALHLWVAAGTQATVVPSATLHVALWVSSGATFKQDLGYVDVPLTSACTGFQEMWVPLNLTGFSVGGGDKSSYTVHARVATGGATVRLGYDTTALRAALQMSVK